MRRDPGRRGQLEGGRDQRVELRVHPLLIRVHDVRERRVRAGLIMGIGLLTLAMVTAQVASSFVTQAPSQVRPSPQPEPVTPEVTLAELDRRLARIEQLLTATSPSERATGAPEHESGSDWP
jgi:hypothetical protein